MARVNSFVTYGQPIGEFVALTIQPRLASWDRQGHPSQVALVIFLDHVEGAVGQHVQAIGSKLALALSGPLPRGDLDNFLYPIVARLGHDRFLSARAVRDVNRPHRLVVGPAVPESWPINQGDIATAFIRTRTSTAKAAWKNEIRDQIVGRTAQSTGPLTLEICFRLTGLRNWAWLWKPAIDALGPLLGEGARPFHPRDDRIVDLRLHRVVDDSLGYDVELAIRCSPPAHT